MRPLVSLLFALALFGADAEQKIELGYFGTTGNSQTTSLTAAYRLDTKLTPSDRLTFWCDLLYASKDGKQSSERYRGYLDLEHTLREDLYLFGQILLLRNTFEGYNQQYNLSVGLGKEIFSSKKQQLDILAGYQFRRNNLVRNLRKSSTTPKRSSNTATTSHPKIASPSTPTRSSTHKSKKIMRFALPATSSFGSSIVSVSSSPSSSNMTTHHLLENIKLTPRQKLRSSTTSKSFSEPSLFF